MLPLVIIAAVAVGGALIKDKRDSRRRKTFRIKSVQTGRNYVEINKDGVTHIRFWRDKNFKIIRSGFNVSYSNGEFSDLKNQAGSQVIYTTEVEEIYAYESIFDSDSEEITKP